MAYTMLLEDLVKSLRRMANIAREMGVEIRLGRESRRDDFENEKSKAIKGLELHRAHILPLKSLSIQTLPLR